MDAPSDISDIIVDARAYADGRIHDALAYLRREAPIARISAKGHTPFWLVSRHADIMAAELRASDFSSGDMAVTLPSDPAMNPTAENPQGLLRTLVNADGADHRALRKLSQSYFMPQNIKKLEKRIRELAQQSVSRLAELGGECEFTQDIALHYPLRVIMEILGVPQEDEKLMLRLTQEMFGGEDKDINRSGSASSGTEVAEGIREAVMEFMEYFAKLAADRQANPRDDLATLIANGQIHGQQIGLRDIIGYYLIIATAGHDTTSNTTASGMWALAERPEVFNAIKADRSLIGGHVDESVRWASSVRHFMRGATTDTELAGTPIAKGDWLMLSYLSGNRDESVFENPFEYDIRRPNKHIAFGYGPHVCLGQHLGRMEMRIFWEEVFQRLDSVELADTPSLSSATFVGGPKRLPIHYKMT